MKWWRLLLAPLLALLVSSEVEAQRELQLWGNFTLDWVKSDRITYEVDFEPKMIGVVTPGEPGWRNLDVTPSVSFTPTSWLDLTGDLIIGYTKQDDELNTFEVTPRVGVMFHLLSRDLPTLVRKRLLRSERPPKRRMVLRDYARVEWRNFSYNRGEPGSSTWRFRNRLEFLFPLNRQKITDDGAQYMLADWEWFVPFSDPTERFANQQRIRAGFGYRHNFNWRFEALYMWTLSRTTIDEKFKPSNNAIDLRVKCFF